MDNKMKKVGLTALAGSLAATTGYAADMSVSGSWAVSYDTNDTSTVTGNPLTLGDSITFSASGETDQGWTVGMSYELDYGGVLDDLKATLDMGDAGKFTFGESAGGSGIRAVKNIVPAADTAVYSMSATTTAYGMARGISQTGYIGYDISMGDVTMSFDTSKTTGGTNRSLSLNYTGIDGLQVVAGAAETLTAQANAGVDQETVGVKYTMGSITVAAQLNEVDDASTSNDDEDATHIGISFALNDQVSISYAQLETDFGKSTKTADETVSGVGVSYTAGSMSVKAYAGKTENNAGSATAADLEEKGVTLSFSF